MKLLAALLFATALFSLACSTPDYGRPLPPGAPALIALKPKEKRPDFREGYYNREELMPALDRSIDWMKKPSSPQFFPMEGVSFDRARESLLRFRELLAISTSAEEFTRNLALEFTVYKSAGWNAKGGGVLFTAYCTPILEGSRTKTELYKYPLYALPPDLVKGDKGAILGRRTDSGGIEPYPTRRAIEASSLLSNKGLELVYLRDPLDAFIAHVNGSAFIDTPTGESLKFGYSGKNGQPYSSLGKELIAAKELSAKDMSLAKIRGWGAKNPEKLSEYMARNESYVFFVEIDGNPRGSLNVEVEGGRTLATDKALFPRGGVVFVDTKLKNHSNADQYFSCFMLDQDTGGAIRTAGRGDIYLGIGPEAERRAGKTMAEGQLYYLFLNEKATPRSVAP
jgi:membrane-bound lytic murein transglycosylase A